MKRLAAPFLTLGTVVLIGCLLSGCAGPTYWAFLDITLDGVQRPADAEQRYGEIQLHTLDTDDGLTYTMSDGLIQATVIPGSDLIALDIENLGAESIRILWDEGAFIDIDRQSRRIVHGGVRFLEIEDPQTPSVVAGRSFFEDVVVPADNIAYLPSLTKWIKHSLLPVLETDVEGEEGLAIIRIAASRYMGKDVRLLLPLEVGDRRFEYVFEFHVNACKVWTRVAPIETRDGIARRVSSNVLVETVTE